jgi:hypothetical protein
VGENLTAPHYQKKGDLFEKLNLTGIPHYWNSTHFSKIGWIWIFSSVYIIPVTDYKIDYHSGFRKMICNRSKKPWLWLCSRNSGNIDHSKIAKKLDSDIFILSRKERIRLGKKEFRSFTMLFYCHVGTYDDQSRQWDNSVKYAGLEPRTSQWRVAVKFPFSLFFSSVLFILSNVLIRIGLSLKFYVYFPYV